MQMGRLSSSSYKPRIITMNNNHNNRSSSTNSHHGQCKKHPKHRQSPGVCSLCLSEKLSKVSNTSNTSSSSSYNSRARAAYYCSSSSLSSSDDDDSCASSPSSSPPHRYHRRIASDVMLRHDGGARGFAKSRSMAAVVAARNQDASRLRSDNNSNSKKVISGFWAKILRPRRNKKSREIMIKNIAGTSTSTSTSTAVY